MNLRSFFEKYPDENLTFMADVRMKRFISKNYKRLDCIFKTIFSTGIVRIASS